MSLFWALQNAWINSCIILACELLIKTFPALLLLGGNFHEKSFFSPKLPEGLRLCGRGKREGLSTGSSESHILTSIQIPSEGMISVHVTASLIAEPRSVDSAE